MHYLHTVYDFHNEPIIPRFAYVFLALSAITTLIFFYNKNHGFFKFVFGHRKYVFLAMSGMGVFIFLIISAMKIRQYYEAKRLFDNKQYYVVEGVVQDYIPTNGRDGERFRVDSLYFNLSDNDLSTFGYTKAASEGGFIRNDLYVKIFYADAPKISILKLEIE